MTPRTEKQYKAIRRERRESIMNTALELFAEKGFESTSISQIANQAGISKGLIYNYFNSKEHLLEQLVHSALERVPELLNPPGDLQPHEQLQQMLDVFKRELRGDTTFWKFYTQLGFQLLRYPEILDKFEPETRAYINRIRRLMQDLGYGDPATVGMQFLALLDGIALHFLFFDEYPLDKILDSVYQSYANHD